MRYHHTSIRMAWMKNSDNIKCCQGCGETGSVIAGRHVKWYSHSGLCNNRGLQKYVVFSIQLSKAGLAEQSQRLMILPFGPFYPPPSLPAISIVSFKFATAH